MPTRTGGYWVDGVRVPSVTTVLGNIGWSAGALKGWAYNQGKAGKDLYESTDMDAGTLAHAKIEAFIHGQPFTPPADASFEVLALAQTAFESAREWLDDMRLTIIATEAEMVSPTYRYGGTADAVGVKHDGKVCLLDWKAAKGTYPDHIVQVAAYTQLWEETTHIPIERVYVCRFDKLTGGHSPKMQPRDAIMGDPWQAFLEARALHNRKYRVERLCA